MICRGQVNDMKGEINVYVCQKCHGHTVTIDRDDGTTPFLLGCRADGTTHGCKGMAKSTFYRASFSHQKPIWEWYKPGQEELHKTRDVNMLRHYALGGLNIRRIEEKKDD